MDIYARDDDGGEEQDEASADIVNAYNAHGVTELCIGTFFWYYASWFLYFIIILAIIISIYLFRYDLSRC